MLGICNFHPGHDVTTGDQLLQQFQSVIEIPFQLQRQVRVG